ncbi:MAG TPA: polyhydroxyalkanoic acid system family protein [Gammaproteobacteria bacterium]|nr:polyhydroxyalkanoic acid system family protein [Gammaproteobacteria bacterium]
MIRLLALAGILASAAVLAPPLPATAAPSRTGAAPAATQAPQDYRALVVSMPNHVSRPEARRRIENAIEELQRDYGLFFTVERQTWSGYHLRFRARVLGQPAVGTVDVTNAHVNLRVLLPQSLTMLADMAQPVLLKGGTAMLAKK